LLTSNGSDDSGEFVRRARNCIFISSQNVADEVEYCVVEEKRKREKIFISGRSSFLSFLACGLSAHNLPFEVVMKGTSKWKSVVSHYCCTYTALQKRKKQFRFLPYRRKRAKGETKISTPVDYRNSASSLLFQRLEYSYRDRL
jgi:hypothetical protein